MKPLGGRWPNELPTLPAPTLDRLQFLAAALAQQAGRALGRAEPPRLWTRHILDSLSALPHLPAQGRVVDVGSGAGLPGLPLAVAAPHLAFTLVEPRSERARWLRQVTDAHGLTHVEVVEAPWQASPLRHYDLALARALAAVPQTLEILRSGPPVDRFLVYAAQVDVPPGLPFHPWVLDKRRGLVDIVGSASPKDRKTE